MYTFKNIKMRSLEFTDLEFLRSLRNDESTWMNLTYIGMISSEKQREWYSDLVNSKNKKYFIVYDDSKRIGVIRMDEIDYINRSMRVGCDISPEHRGQGFGTETMKMVVDYCFNFLNMHRLWLCVLEYNKKAIKIYDNVGFKKEGKYKQAIFRKGKYWDYIIMSLIRGNNE